MKTFILSLFLVLSFSAISQTQYVLSSDSVRIAYEVHSESRKEGMPVLVFVHGWSCDRTYWKKQIPYFAKKLKVVTIDLGGHGESGLGRKNWTMEAYGEDVASVIKKINAHNVILLGHSMGGSVIAEAAMRIRDRVSGLILIDAYNELGPGFTPEQAEEFIVPFKANFSEKTKSFVHEMFRPNADPEIVKQVTADMASAPSEVGISALQSLLNYLGVMPQTLKKLNLPVVVINTDVQPTDTKSMEQYGVQVMVMEGAGHFMMMENPNHFNPMLMEAIQRLNQ